MNSNLTIGMATYNDFDGVFFTISSLRHHNKFDGPIIVVDNAPCKTTKTFCEKSRGVIYYERPDLTGTSKPRDAIFQFARTDYVMVVDCHVLLFGLDKLYDYLPQVEDDLCFAALVGDNGKPSTHWSPEWQQEQYGVWRSYPTEEPVQIPMMGLGAFLSKRDKWLGFHPDFTEFGVEEGYIAAKYYQNDRRLMCLPFWKYFHRFYRPRGMAYPAQWESTYRNMLIGRKSLGLPIHDVKEVYAKKFGVDWTEEIETALGDNYVKHHFLPG